MQHLAILRKSWKLLPKILSREKKIESRWYKNKSAPYNNIKKGDMIFFKNSGEPVTIKAEVSKVIQVSDLNYKKIKLLLNRYGKALGIDDIPKFARRFKDKRYVILIFLKNPKSIKPFKISKKGFGNMSAWITIPNIRNISE